MFLKKKIILLIFFSLSLILLFFYNNHNKKSHTQIGGNFQLTNHLGQKTTNDSFNGYYRLVFFGFTNCPDFCPDTLNNIGAIISSFNNIHEQLPTSCNLSTFYSPQYFPGILLFDIYKTQTSDNLEMRIGIEITVTDYLLLRLGNSSNAFELIDPYSSYFTGMSSGIGIQSKHWNLDLGFFNLETAGIITGLSLLYKQ